ncbi:GNAT family N-acetyltransferase [Psychrobacillus glaciei]|uniref:GNAT family N-acetyltransferase n=1 Tax=Psychrobacillus glaciei TaxID=2283160 RepID=A0A5J6SKV4_9BACI|nr:GNAT family N-acetyltransferase [Psychrobacillus glaciei]QFF98272.1 GNAT family N-acetyltransferase [Psychrobacillus glaciei]
MVNAKIVETDNEYQDAIFIRRKVFVEEQDVPIHLELDEHDQNAIHFVAYDDEIPFGAGRIRTAEPNVGKIERVCILPEYRGKKLGNLMMQCMEDYAHSNGYHKLKLNSQSHAVPFYEKRSYSITSPEFLEAGIPHRAMEKLFS